MDELIIKALKSLDQPIYIKSGSRDRSLYWDTLNNKWIVRDTYNYLTIHVGDSFEDALKVLLKEE